MIVNLIVCFIAYLIAQYIISRRSSKDNSLSLPTGNVLIFDTETNGLPQNWKAQYDDVNNWPRMVSLAWYCIKPTGEIIDSGYTIIRPESYTINNSTSIHGITNVQASTSGNDLHSTLESFIKQVNGCKYLIAHNIEFDFAVIYSECLRKKVDPMNLKTIKKVCTMKQSTEFCKLPGKRGFKYPSLTELYRKLFAETLNNTHNAKADAEACMLCFKELYNRKVITF